MKAKNLKSNSHNQPLLLRAWRMVVCLCVLLATGALAGCQFMKPVDGPGMEREVNDSLDSDYKRPNESSTNDRTNPPQTTEQNHLK
jgi:hypothetical protein